MRHYGHRDLSEGSKESTPGRYVAMSSSDSNEKLGKHQQKARFVELRAQGRS